MKNGATNRKKDKRGSIHSFAEAESPPDCLGQAEIVSATRRGTLRLSISEKLMAPTVGRPRSRKPSLLRNSPAHALGGTKSHSAAKRRHTIAQRVSAGEL
jgi:hypothetical protein